MGRKASRSWQPYVTLTVHALFKTHRPNLCRYANYVSCETGMMILLWTIYTLRK